MAGPSAGGAGEGGATDAVNGNEQSCRDSRARAKCAARFADDFLGAIVPKSEDRDLGRLSGRTRCHPGRHTTRSSRTEMAARMKYNRPATPTSIDSTSMPRKLHKAPQPVKAERHLKLHNRLGWTPTTWKRKDTQNSPGLGPNNYSSCRASPGACTESMKERNGKTIDTFDETPWYCKILNSPLAPNTTRSVHAASETLWSFRAVMNHCRCERKVNGRNSPSRCPSQLTILT